MSLRKKRIAVVSRDADFTDFFAWEARACGCPVETFVTPPEELLRFDFLVLDVRAGICLAGESGCAIAAVMTGGRHTAAMQADLVWPWPVSLREVHEAFEGLCETAEGEVASQKREKSEHEQKIYLLSEEGHAVLYRNQTISLTECEWMLLSCLGEACGDAVSRERLQSCMRAGESNSLNVHMCHLRKKLEEPFGIRLIETLRGGGYRLRIPTEYWK